MDKLADLEMLVMTSGGRSAPMRSTARYSNVPAFG
jgi:hypothetical protein